MSDSPADELFEELSFRTRSLFTKSKRNNPEFHGSGFFTKVRNQLYLVTARHVVEEWSQTAPLFFDCGPGKQICQLEGAEYLVRDSNGSEVDAAIIELSTRASARVDEGLVVPVSLLQDEAQGVKAENYLVAGYPVARNRNAVSRDRPTITPSLYGIVTVAADERELQRLCRNASDYIALGWNQKVAYSLDGEKRAGPKLHGLSGAPIWSIREYEPSVAGILIEYHGRACKIIVGVRSHLILRAVGR